MHHLSTSVSHHGIRQTNRQSEYAPFLYGLELTLFCLVFSTDYPAPLVSTRHRRPVYGEIGHTIMNLLADFHDFQYTVPQISGLLIHMEDKRTSVRLPIGRYEAVSFCFSLSQMRIHRISAMSADNHTAANSRRWSPQRKTA